MHCETGCQDEGFGGGHLRNLLQYLLFVYEGDIATDDRSYEMHLANGLDVAATNVYFYPRLIPIVSNQSASVYVACFKALMLTAVFVCTMTAPLVAVVPPFCLCSSLVHSLRHLLLFITFSLFLFSFTLLIFFYCPLSHSVSRHEVIGGDRTRV